MGESEKGKEGKGKLGSDPVIVNAVIGCLDRIWCCGGPRHGAEPLTGVNNQGHSQGGLQQPLKAWYRLSSCVDFLTFQRRAHQLCAAQNSQGLVLHSAAR